MKTLHLDTLYNTPVEVTAKLTLAEIFPPNITFIFGLLDGSYVMYQLRNEELLKADSLAELLKETFNVSEQMFKDYYASPLSDKEKDFVSTIFCLNDNYNLSTNLYKLI